MGRSAALSIIVLLAGVAAAIAVLGIVGYAIFCVLRNQFSAPRRVIARIARKRHQAWDVSVPRLGVIGFLGILGTAVYGLLSRNSSGGIYDDATVAEGVDCYVTFRFDGRELELSVPQKVYITLDEGTEGLLVYRGEQFKHFIAGVGHLTGV